MALAAPLAALTSINVLVFIIDALVRAPGFSLTAIA